jgi:hypothetical protein
MLYIIKNKHACFFMLLQLFYFFYWYFISSWNHTGISHWRWVLIFFFMFMWPCIVTNFYVIKPTRCTNFTNLFCHETLHVLDSSSVHHQEFIHCTPLLSVQWINSWWWTYELSDTCRVSWQNKFVKLVHLFGFITKKSGFWCLLQFYWSPLNMSIKTLLYILTYINITRHM